jgi:hypothetical protein
VIGPKALFVNGQGAAHKRLGFGQFAKIAKNGPHIVNCTG